MRVRCSYRATLVSKKYITYTPSDPLAIISSKRRLAAVNGGEVELPFLGLGLELGVWANDNFTYVRGVIKANRIWHVLYMVSL